MKTMTSCRWAFDLSTWIPTCGEWCKAMQCLQLEERQRIHRFKYKQDAKASLAGRLMIQKWVQQVLREEKMIVRSDKGRPTSPHPSWDFNVSHAGHFTAFAAQKAACGQDSIRIGVDLMRLSDQRFSTESKKDDFFRLMQRKFAPSEWEEIRNPEFFEASLSSRQLATFFRHWCLKESYAKAVGLGVNMDLKAMDFKTKSPLVVTHVVTDTILTLNQEIQHDWIFEESLLDSDHSVSVAVCKSDPTCTKGFERIELFSDLYHDLRPFSMQESIDDWTDFERKKSVKPF